MAAARVALCAICHDRAADFRCYECHKPVCDPCALKTEHGAFCSRECAAQFGSYKRAQAESSSRGRGSARRLILVLLLIAAAAALVLWRMEILRLPGLTSGP